MYDEMYPLELPTLPTSPEEVSESQENVEIVLLA